MIVTGSTLPTPTSLGLPTSRQYTPTLPTVITGINPNAGWRRPGTNGTTTTGGGKTGTTGGNQVNTGTGAPIAGSNTFYNAMSLEFRLFAAGGSLSGSLLNGSQSFYSYDFFGPQNSGGWIEQGYTDAKFWSVELPGLYWAQKDEQLYSVSLFKQIGPPKFYVTNPDDPAALDRLGNTVRKHEQSHVNIDERWFNEWEQSLANVQGVYKPAAAVDIVRQAVNALQKIMESNRNAENANFDLRAYGAGTNKEQGFLDQTKEANRIRSEQTSKLDQLESQFRAMGAHKVR